MPPTARRPVAIGEGSEPPAGVNPAPPVLPGRGSDVDPSVRVENVGAQVPSIPLATEPDLSQFLRLDPDPAAPPVAGRPGEYVGWSEPPVELTGVRHEFEPDGQPYVVLARPWVNVLLADDRFVTGRRGDIVVLHDATAQRGLETGTIIPAEQFVPV
jgi:hypothetical protein